MRCVTANLISNREVSPGVHELVLPCAGRVTAGRFFMLKAPGGAALLPRPISACDFADGKIVFLVQRVGKGTAELCALRPGDPVQMTGPLGNGFPLSDIQGELALIGGGIGIAPMLLTARELAAKGRAPDCYLGFRNRPYYAEEFRPFVKSLSVSTDDGCTGFHGNVAQMLDPARYAAVLCCGPTRMMEVVTALCMAAGTPVYVSLENRMACGVGGCLVCTCATKNQGNLRTCMEGPVFRGEDVVFE